MADKEAKITATDSVPVEEAAVYEAAPPNSNVQRDHVPIYGE